MQRPKDFNEAAVVAVKENCYRNHFCGLCKYFKYLIGYKNNQKIMQLCIMIPNMSGYENSFANTK